jgi:Fic family protein
MKPPYELTAEILHSVTHISEKIGAVNASFLTKASPQLRKQNQIKTIHSSLQIEGNTLTQDQMTAVLENKKVMGPSKDILEVQNALAVYSVLADFKFADVKSFLNAHKILMTDLIAKPGTYRKEGVGIVKGSAVQHVAPPATNVPFLMNDLFDYLKNDAELVLIKSCVFHYEMEFIHPFGDGNGRMGRLWQTVILLSHYPLFQFLPFETLIAQNQNAYYQVLAHCDKEGKSTRFIAYMLQIIDDALAHLLNNAVSVNMTQVDRLSHFCSLKKKSFTRKDYLQVFKQISSASASRDLKEGIVLGLFTRTGDKRSTTYQLVPTSFARGKQPQKDF